MCELVSTVEKGGKVYFLTSEQIYNTPRGELARLASGSPDDYLGHGFIRKYYNDLEGGVDKEYTDFSSPANFPAVLVKAIKAGEFRGLACPSGLLSAPADKAYQEAKATAWQAYREAKAPAWKAYREASATVWKAYREALATADKAYQEALAPTWKAYLEASATVWKAYQEAKAPTWQAYQEAKATADKAYQEAKAPADKAYQEAKAPTWQAYQEAKATVWKAYLAAVTPAFWDLFADPANRAEAWR